MKLTLVFIIFSLPCAVALPQHIGFEQGTFIKKKLTIINEGGQYRWTAQEGDFRIDESEFWRIVGNSAISRQAAVHTNRQEPAKTLNLLSGTFVGITGLCLVGQGALYSETTKSKIGFTVVGFVGIYAAYRILHRRFNTFASYEQARGAAQQYNDSLRTSLRLSQ